MVKSQLIIHSKIEKLKILSLNTVTLSYYYAGLSQIWKLLGHQTDTILLFLLRNHHLDKRLVYYHHELFFSTRIVVTLRTRTPDWLVPRSKFTLWVAIATIKRRLRLLLVQSPAFWQTGQVTPISLVICFVFATIWEIATCIEFSKRPNLITISCPQTSQSKPAGSS